jgi:hypothetical protein
VFESPIQRIANRLVADWIKGMTHSGDDHSVGVGHFFARDAEGEVKRNEAVISSVDDSQGNSAGNSLRDGTGWLTRVPFRISPHVGVAFSEEPTQLRREYKALRTHHASSIVRKNVEGSSPHAFGQPNDVRVILRRGQTVHEDDNGPRYTVERPGASRELDAVTRQQPRVLDGPTQTGVSEVWARYSSSASVGMCAIPSTIS